MGRVDGKLTACSVPVYDGREQFQLGKYWETPYIGVVAKGSTVMLLFTIRKGALPKGTEEAEGMPDTVKCASYLNVVGVVVLAEPSDTFSKVRSQEGPNDAGVQEIMELPEPMDSESEDGEDPLM